MPTSQLEPGELPSTPPQKPFTVHPTPDKKDQDYSVSNRRKSKLYSDTMKPVSKLRSRYVDRSPTPPLPQDRRKPRSPSPRKRRRERTPIKKREHAPKKRRSPTPPRRRQKPAKRTSPPPPKKQSTFSNWVDLTKKPKPTMPSAKPEQNASKRGVNASRVKGLEKANSALKENVEYFRQSSQANSYKYELMKVKAQEENGKRKESDRKLQNLQAENAWLRNMVNFPNFGATQHPQYGMQIPRPNFPYAPPPPAPISAPVEQSSVESIVLPEALKIRARSPAK